MNLLRKLCLVLLLCAGSASAATVTLAWDPSPGTNVAGYHIYYGSASGSYTNTVDAGACLTITVTNLGLCTTYFFAATAYDSNGLESDFSNEISYSVPCRPVPPPNLHITGVRLTVMSAPAWFGPWTERSNVPPFLVYDPLPVEFYRLSVIATNATQL